ncbi:Uncharacterized protein FKW44_014075, partial [Caligus rogercresseyi]
MRSLMGINDGKKFTAQLQISANLISFSQHCKDCGRLYVNIRHAFCDCPSLAIIK